MEEIERKYDQEREHNYYYENVLDLSLKTYMHTYIYIYLNEKK